MRQTEGKRTFVRYQALLMLADGSDIASVAKSIQRSVRVIYQWLHRYLKTRKTDVLHEAPRSGRPLIGAAITDKRILAALNRSPVSCGYHVNAWTTVLLADYMSRKYNCPISDHTLRRRMKAMGLRYKRPRYIYSEKDPNRAQKKGLSSES